MLALVVYEIFSPKSFSDVGVGDGDGGVNAICCRPEVVVDVTSGEVVPEDVPGNVIV